MGKNDLIEVEGTVSATRGNGSFLVKIDASPNLSDIPCKLAGKLRKNAIRVLLGDRVKVSISPYDLTHGLITYRMK